jgi:hypothetical protein
MASWRQCRTGAGQFESICKVQRQDLALLRRRIARRGFHFTNLGRVSCRMCRHLQQKLVHISRGARRPVACSCTEDDLREFADLIAILERKVGRLIFNGFPTGVEVTHAMIHAGPYPATSDGRSNSVGSQAIFRFARPVCYQDFPDSALPQELRDGNPLGIWRMLDGKFTRVAVGAR